MSNHKKVVLLLAALAVVFFTPYISLYVYKGEIPENFFHFPPTKPTFKPGPEPLVIWITIGFFVFSLLFWFFPRLFGFKKPDNAFAPDYKTAEKSPDEKPIQRLPIWFWIGGLIWISILLLFIFKADSPKWLLNWALVPFWWGFIHLLDGIVYYRNNGKSLVSSAPSELIAMGVLSISGWLIFEYFNFFVELNWYYPKANILPHDEFLLYAMIGSSAFIPMCFEWYHFLKTFPKLNRKYVKGPKIKASGFVRILLILLSLCGLFFAIRNPNGLFYVIWLAPLIILILVLGQLRIWTPFTEIRDTGNWTSLMLFAPTFFIQGILVECWNWLSAIHLPGGETESYNPGFWRYCIPYVSTSPIFEMPVLGYLGYVPFSIYCFIWFIAMAFLMNISTSFTFDKSYR